MHMRLVTFFLSFEKTNTPPKRRNCANGKKSKRSKLKENNGSKCPNQKKWQAVQKTKRKKAAGETGPDIISLRNNLTGQHNPKWHILVEILRSFCWSAHLSLKLLRWASPSVTALAALRSFCWLAHLSLQRLRWAGPSVSRRKKHAARRGAPAWVQNGGDYRQPEAGKQVGSRLCPIHHNSNL